MKKYMGYAAAAVSMAAMAAMCMPAMAEDVVTDTTAAEAAEKTTEAEAETVGYSVVEAEITGVEETDRDYTRITVNTEERGEVILNEGSDCMVIEGKEIKSINDLKAGMKVKIVMDDMAPMTLSLPPQTSGAIAIIIEGEDLVNVEVADFDDELSSKYLKLNMDENVIIQDIKGSRKMFTADDIKGHKAIVLYGASTRSIPAQTTPSMVIILDGAEDIPEITVIPETESVPLRATLEKMGYTVEWTANNAPIVVEKDGVSVSLEIGKNTVVKEGDMAFELTSAVEFKDGVTYIPSDALEIFE